MKAFITKNYVFIVGLLSALSLFLEQAITTSATDIKVILTGALMALIGYVANSWKMGGLTVTGIVGSLAYVFVQLNDGSPINWTTFILLALAKILAAATASLQAYKPNDSNK